MTYNERTVTLKLKRIDVCDILLALGAVANESDVKKWDELHEKVKEILNDFDEKNFQA